MAKIVKKLRENRVVNLLQEFSIPLIAGAIIALFAANLTPHFYHAIVHHKLFDMKWLSMHFAVNEIFMAFFFGIAAKEITESFSKGGALHPVKKAINPILAAIGGVLVPILVFFILTSVFGLTDLNRGWGIPTATDIALAWLAARIIFGKGHNAINFLLLLAILDDAIGLGIIATFYGDPSKPTQVSYLILVAIAMLVAWGLRKAKVKNWAIYVVVPGVISWIGLYYAHLHPALALVPVIPFLPGPKEDIGLYEEDTNYDKDEQVHEHSPLEKFEHDLKWFVDFGLFFFAFANAGVAFSDIGPITWVILTALIFGKTIGIFGMGVIAHKLGFTLPEGMSYRDLLIAGVIAGLGLTVALFFCGAAYTGDLIHYQGQAKMGALFSVLAFFIAFVLKKALNNK